MDSICPPSPSSSSQVRSLRDIDDGVARAQQHLTPTGITVTVSVLSWPPPPPSSSCFRLNGSRVWTISFSSASSLLSFPSSPFSDSPKKASFFTSMHPFSSNVDKRVIFFAKARERLDALRSCHPFLEFLLKEKESFFLPSRTGKNRNFNS